MGATNTLERLAAMMGEISEVTIQFQTSVDIPHGGVLFALPALLSMGLLHHSHRYFQLPNGYYGLDSLFLLLAFMALARIKSIEQLRYCAPGEWGKLLGLDRVPEVRTLRAKLKLLSTEGAVEHWGAQLCADWMETDLADSVLLYIDGHVRVYHGSQTKLPRHHVARQRLCLRATTDYWVNAMDGQPFFFINKAVDPGLVKVIEADIVPRLEDEVPHQPSLAVLEEDALLPRFSLIFDREGYSPAMMRRLKQKRIACFTYHKHPGEDWAEEEFRRHPVQLVSGEIVEMDLAERGTWLGNELWVREIRKLTDSGHQTAIITTNFKLNGLQIAASMFARWSQENFFRYMRQHYNLDALADHCVDTISETTRVVNPAYRELDSKLRSLNGILNRRLAKFGSLNLESDIEPKKVDAFEKKKAKLLEEIDGLHKQVLSLKARRAETDKHITVAELPEEAKFAKLRTQSKHLIDTIKMIGYRAETAMVNLLREKMSRSNDARQLITAIYQTEADLFPDYREKTLRVRLHRLANTSNDQAIENLCRELNETETIFPGTELRLIYEFGINE
jgi:Transposase protein